MIYIFKDERSNLKMSELSVNIEKLKSQVKTFSSYLKNGNDKETKKNVFTDLQLNEKKNIGKVLGRKKVLLLVLIPLFITVFLLILKPSFIMTKKDNDKSVPVINKSNLLLFVFIISCCIIFLLVKKTSFFN